MVEHGARTVAAVQQRLSHATPEEAESILRLAHRTMVLDALQSLPRKALPRDLGALGIVVEAAELFAIALYFSRGSTTTKGFVGEGLEHLQEWLARCRSLFQRFDDLFDEFPAPSRGAGQPRKVAAAYWGVVNQMFSSIMEHIDIEDAAEEERAEDSDEEPPKRDILAVPGDTLKELATALGSIMCCWMAGSYVDPLMAQITAGHEALCDCRALVTVAEPEHSKGNA